jgi:hypothetical protein
MVWSASFFASSAAWDLMCFQNHGFSAEQTIRNAQAMLSPDMAIANVTFISSPVLPRMLCRAFHFHM